jgi:isoleucyl-tRNA synthetase
MSTMMEGRAPFKTLLGHALVRDEEGEEMHKSKGNAIPFDEAADKMGSDVMRWMFCRHNPVNNLNFGYGPGEEILTRFVLKLWNTYAFFCNYARLDRFDPKAPWVPVRERPDIDRWILSDLQLLIHRARQDFERFNVQSFCLQMEQFVDDRLSNWYVRRNRRRFWKSEASSDKQAAYQTLYAVLMTLSKLLAPVVPFLTEAMYQNLTGETTSSVHLADFPRADESLIDADLSADMDALLRLISLGSAARNSVKIKVRQPLAELRVRPGDERDRRAVERFADQIEEELNIKKVTLVESARGPLLLPQIKLNLKTAGPKFGARLKDIQAALAGADPICISRDKTAGSLIRLSTDSDLMLDPDDVVVQFKAPEGWAGSQEKDTQVIIDVRLTPELGREGMARDIIRQVQELRKIARLEMEDRIVLHLGTTSTELARAIKEHRARLANETLTAQWSDQPMTGPGVHRADAKIDGQPLAIQLCRA